MIALRLCIFKGISYGKVFKVLHLFCWMNANKVYFAFQNFGQKNVLEPDLIYFAFISLCQNCICLWAFEKSVEIIIENKLRCYVKLCIQHLKQDMIKKNKLLKIWHFSKNVQKSKKYQSLVVCFKHTTKLVVEHCIKTQLFLFERVSIPWIRR